MLLPPSAGPDARKKGLVPPAFLIDKALAQLQQSAKGAREGGSLVESIERRTKEKNIPGNWAERARAITQKQVAPALDRQPHFSLASERTGVVRPRMT